METMTALANNLDVSLDDRIAASKTNSKREPRDRDGGGPRRTERRKGRSGAQRMKDLAPYKRGDSESNWKHDLYGPAEGIQGGVLGARMMASPNNGSSAAGPRGKVDLSSVKGFLSAAAQDTGKKGISLRGAGTGTKTTVRVENLMEGTTAADVEAIFKAAGPILSSRQTKTRGTVTIELVYKTSEGATEAVKRYDGQVADGQELRVTVVDKPGGTSIAGAANGNSDSLIGRLGITSKKGGDLLDDDDSGSGMRSDALLDDPRAQVITMDAAEGGNGRERGNGRRRGRR